MLDWSPNQSLEPTAGRPDAHICFMKQFSALLRICHPRFGYESRFTGLAVADLVSR
jgi:hypothetical protein